jgi:flagellar secretion chaperone FliS
MNAKAAIKKYTAIKTQTLSSQDIGYNVVNTALVKLETSLQLLLTSTNPEKSAKAFEVALLTIYFLQKSLDFKDQGNLAINLYRLYEFCRVKLIEIGIQDSFDNHEIRKCHSFVNEIRLSWATVKNK